ncbi:hypothetical protein [Paractinoplanes durhamensis]|uniref:hypothetical protein n=1 Tax=Paractinoplanes durhamensis TaxID=113563 RepID=UPI00363F83AA
MAAFVAGTTYLALTGQAESIDPDVGRWAASLPVDLPPASSVRAMPDGPRVILSGR